MKRKRLLLYAIQPFISQVLLDELGIHVHFNGQDIEQSELLHGIIEQGWKVVSFKEAETDLEDVFLEITKGVRQ